MKTIYLNCESGVSGDMVLKSLTGLAEDPAAVQANIRRVTALVEEKGSGASADREVGIHSPGHAHFHDHEHGHDHAHKHGHNHTHVSHRSYREVMEIISSIPVSSRVKRTAEQIYAVIAKAESAVHGDPLENLHFHEVGRDQAIANVMGVAVCIDALRPDRILTSTICDGQGTVRCAHGLLEVPVPAVKAMLQDCGLAYQQTQYEGEMVTPSGLAMVIGMGAQTGSVPAGTPVRQCEARGGRTFTDHGLIASLYED